MRRGDRVQLANSAEKWFGDMWPSYGTVFRRLGPVVQVVGDGELLGDWSPIQVWELTAGCVVVEPTGVPQNVSLGYRLEPGENRMTAHPSNEQQQE